MTEVPATPLRPRRALRLGIAAAVLVLGAACESDQDPGLDPGPGAGTAETSDTLGACPSGGPDATTPDAGCLDSDGSVQRP